MTLVPGRGGWFLGVVCGVLLFAPRVHAEMAYRVKEGDTLWGIARKHGCDAQEVARQNRVTIGTTIYPGSRLKIPRCAEEATGAGSRKSTTLAMTAVPRVTARHGQNPLERPTMKAADAPPPPSPGQSFGYPFAGRLIGADQMPAGPGYFRRRPSFAYGTSYTIENLRRSIAAVFVEHPELHRIAIGDISSKKGGRIVRHQSHQSGRDVDVGFFFKKKPAGYPKNFVKATSENLHFQATWLFLQTLLRTAARDGGVERIFLSYDTQRLLYLKAKAQGVSERDLEVMFQYPHGSYAARGLIRHEPNHEDHFHVRFKCLQNDGICN